jgi:DNA modification methylase
LTDTVVKKQCAGENFNLYNSDCIEGMRAFPDEVIDIVLTSPPYQNLYVYSNVVNDVGNSSTDEEFYQHFEHVIKEIFRILKPGRIAAIDCMNVPAMKERDGYIGLKDFRGDIIRAFQKVGFIYHSEHCMWKDPLIEATRTKSLGLMHKQLCKDSARCRAGLPQYIVAMAKPGENTNPVKHEDGLDSFYGENEPKSGVMSHERWRRYASPVWMDVSFTDTLNAHAARDGADERHICAMSLDAVARCIELWSNPGDIVLDPFVGIGSSVYQALLMGRRGIGFELKDSYYQQAVLNCKRAESDARAPQVGLDQWVGTASGQSKLEV